MKKGEKFKVVIFAVKKLPFDAQFDGKFNGAIFIFLCCTLQRMWKIYLWTFSKLLDDMKTIFEPIDLKFGVNIVNAYITILYGVLEILIFQNFIEYFSLHFIF